MSDGFEVVWSVEGDVAVVRITGEMDLSGRDQLIQAAALSLEAASTLVLDVSGLTFIDSSGLSGVVACRNIAADQGRQFRIRGAAGQVARVLEVTGLRLLAGP